ncbi:HD-GYP domain-containing protein [Methylobrevis albus]|uniref:HD domain-containing protein n=1 Tax=Methylobrevis albus TaxID=2793297 RepID=A0A931I0H9_9HYPH|nr:HD domain-containing phosphohydrolase [Methylobrevis albus]MBH0237184.1 HD domain-containing protein [Methylobrevis albus]
MDDARALATAMARSGIAADLMVIDDLARSPGAVPDAPVYIIAEPQGVATAAAWRAIARPASLRRTIVWGPNVTAGDIVALDNLGIGYVTKAGPRLDPLLRLIGVIDADYLAASRMRVTEAKAVAHSVFQATAAAFEMFGSMPTFDRDFYAGLSQDFSRQVETTPLYLLIDAISRNQDTTIQHCSLVTTVAVAFASHLGLSGREVSRLFTAAFFHDIGKSAIPKSVIDKPGRLTEDETRLMRSHVTVGHEILSRYPETAGEVAEVALHHHEMLDGSGYPQGLRGTEISDLIRIVTICDIFAALIERRSYKEPLPAREAYDIIVGMGPKLDQDLVGAFESVAFSVA